MVEEFITVFTYKFGVPFAQQVWKTLSGLSHFVYYPQDYEKILDNFFVLNKKISFTDLSLILLAFQTESELFSFDKQQFNIYQQYSKVFQ